MTNRDWPLIRRTDGRVERVCPHGCGHPDRALTEAAGTLWQGWMEVHGCDGCCQPQEPQEPPPVVS